MLFLFLLYLKLLCSIGSSSHECLLHPDLSLNEPGPNPEGVLGDMEFDVIDAVLEQNVSEKRRMENDVNEPRFVLFT